MADPARHSGAVAQARDEQVARIVALVDAMAVRGEADALIAPLRPRLQQLRPGRKPRFGRVLFTPLDPVIVAASGWIGGRATVPRNGLESIEALVRAGLGAALAPLEAAIARLPGPDPRAVAAIGTALWKPASAILRETVGAAPPGWIGAGLPEDAFHPTSRCIAAVLAAAGEIQALVSNRPETAPTGKTLRDTMAAALPLGAEACAMLGAVLLTRLPALSGEILAALAALGQQDAPVRASIDLALGTALGTMQTRVAGEIAAAPLADAARSVAAAARLLKGLSRDDAGSRRRETLVEDRASLDAKCRTRFADALTADLIGPLQGLTEPVTAARATELENAARDLRRFEQAARQLGSAEAYDEALRRAAEQVCTLADPSPQGRADRVRLVEILAGPEQALRLLALA